MPTSSPDSSTVVAMAPESERLWGRLHGSNRRDLFVHHFANIAFDLFVLRLTETNAHRAENKKCRQQNVSHNAKRIAEVRETGNIKI